jgi:hypothetical protein
VWINKILIQYNELNFAHFFGENDIQTDVTVLTGQFLEEQLDLSVLKNLFDEDAWKAVQSLHKLKLKMSACRNCRNFFTEKFMKCTECAKPFHFKCKSITAYVIGGKNKKLIWIAYFLFL